MLTLVAIGLVTGIASGLLGVGGGFILVPLLSALAVPLHAVIGASLVFVLATSVSGALRHLRQGTADWRLGLPLMAASAATAAFGSAVSVSLPDRVLGWLFAAVTALALVLFNLPRPTPRERPAGRAGRFVVTRVQVAGEERYAYSYSLVGALLVGAGIGGVTGLLGIGGGFLLVPLLVVLLGIPLPIAIGTSLLSILAAAIAGIATHWTLLGVDPALVGPLVAAGVIGAQAGARLVVWLPRARLRVLYNALLVGATLYMAVRAGLGPAAG
ncbi:MAG TPA: sulfite exporter TauE/SafE family protein [Thermodesulfobacteriota bacterium]